jgi:hypothetical protein
VVNRSRTLPFVKVPIAGKPEVIGGLYYCCMSNRRQREQRHAAQQSDSGLTKSRIGGGIFLLLQRNCHVWNMPLSRSSRRS